jgi:FkbM family methyltransferase
MIDITNFDWGTSNEWYRDFIGKEIFVDNIYEKFFQVKEGDVVFDVGASIGTFSFKIGEKKPKHIFCFEPSIEQFITLVKNTQKFSATCINKGIGPSNGDMMFELYGEKNQIGMATSITFEQVIQDYNINQIDFLKTDCEGGEYDIFNTDNLIWIINNVRKISGEWHLDTIEKKQKFRIFRDTYLRLFKNFEIYSIDKITIKWDLWNEHFIEYYEHIIIYIDNDRD